MYAIIASVSRYQCQILLRLELGTHKRSKGTIKVRIISIFLGGDSCNSSSKDPIASSLRKPVRRLLEDIAVQLDMVGIDYDRHAEVIERNGLRIPKSLVDLLTTVVVPLFAGNTINVCFLELMRHDDVNADSLPKTVQQLFSKFEIPYPSEQRSAVDSLVDAQVESRLRIIFSISFHHSYFLNM